MTRKSKNGLHVLVKYPWARLVLVLAKSQNTDFCTNVTTMPPAPLRLGKRGFNLERCDCRHPKCSVEIGERKKGIEKLLEIFCLSTLTCIA